MFLSTLTPKFYVALTGTSSLISGLILLFEWWYFRKYGASFIEQVSLNHISPWISGTDSRESNESKSNSNPPVKSSQKSVQVWRNHLSLFRGSEYQRFYWAMKKEPLTYYDMNLSAQDHQQFFTCDSDTGKEEYEIMQAAWRERNPAARIKAAHDALEKNKNCAPAYILLAEEEATTIIEAEAILKEGLVVAEAVCRNNHNEAEHRRDTNVLIYIKRRLAMCARKLGRLKEASKIFRDLVKEVPPSMSILNVHENLIEVLLEMQAYADAQAVLARYDDMSLPKSATICYTAALLKTRFVSDKFTPELAHKRTLTSTEMTAIEAIHKAVEFNPHVPSYLLELKALILPPEHVLKRGDSEALAYCFFHLNHWKRVEGAIELLQCTWEGAFRMLPYPIEKGQVFFPHLNYLESADRELLPAFHDVSVYPKREMPFLIIFTAGLCSFTALLAFLLHQYPESVGVIIKGIVSILALPCDYLFGAVRVIFPSNVVSHFYKFILGYLRKFII